MEIYELSDKEFRIILTKYSDLEENKQNQETKQTTKQNWGKNARTKQEV